MQITETGKTSELFIANTNTVYGNEKDIGIYALACAVNDLAAQGAVSFRLSAQISLPLHSPKSRVNAMRNQIKRAIKSQSLPVNEFHAAGGENPAVRVPLVTVTAAGSVPQNAILAQGSMRAGQDIVLTKCVGLEGMLRVMSEKEAELARRFTPTFNNQIKSYKNEIFALSEIDVAKAMGVSAIRQITKGGIFAALWDLALESKCGLSMDIKKMSIKQETIEVCEYFRLNPYQLTSVGSMLMVTDCGEVLADTLNKQGIQASVIGQMTDDHDKIIHNGEEIRYIDRPAPDELMKIFE